jgi:tRNA-binding protein
MSVIEFDEFSKLDIRVGTITKVRNFPEARKPAYQLEVDFGSLGVKKTSAQITELYTKTELLNRQILAVVNFPSKQIANFMSECLILGAVNDIGVILLHPSMRVPNGMQVS